MQLFKHKLKGSALYLSLIIGVVISVFMSLFIMLSGYNHTKMLVNEIHHRLNYNLISGSNIAASPFYTSDRNNKWMNFNNKNDSLKIKKLNWGAYALINVTTKNGKYCASTTGLFGVYTKKDTSLLVSDNGKPLSVSGKVNFSSACFLPSPVLRPAYIEGMSYIGNGDLLSKIKPSPPGIPQLNNVYLTELKQTVSGIDSNTDSLINEILPVSKVDFNGRTAVFQTNNLILSDQIYKGNIKLVAEDVVIKKNAGLEDILIIANKIRVKEGFKGNVHLIARDSIIIEDSCVLKFPSSLVVCNFNFENNDNRLKGIYIGENTIIQGNAICYGQDEANSGVPRRFIKLNRNCEFYGLLYSSGYAHLQGKIFGNVYCDKLIVKTNSATYENHLIDTEIDSKKHAGSLMIAACFNEKLKLTCCKKY